MTTALQSVVPAPEATAAAAPAPAPLPAARLMAQAAAWLMLLALLTGGYVALAVTGKIPANGRDTIGSHLNALLGTFMLLGVAWTLPMLRYGPVGQRRMAWAFIVANYANWFFTAVKAWLNVSGVDYTGHGPNDAIFIILNITVVLPSLAATGAWVYGFRRAS